MPSLLCSVSRIHQKGSLVKEREHGCQEYVGDKNLQNYGGDHICCKKTCTTEVEAEATVSAPFTEGQLSVLKSEHSYVAGCAVQADTDIVLTLKKKVKQLRQQLKIQRMAYNQLISNLHRFTYPDQIRCLRLKPKSARIFRWSNKTVTSCLQLRYATGRKGYSKRQPGFLTVLQMV